MPDNIIEIRPGIRQIDQFPTIDLTDPEGELEALRQVRCLSLGIFSRCSGLSSDHDVAACVNIASSIATIMKSVATARMARTAAQRAVALDLACREALETAETM